MCGGSAMPEPIVIATPFEFSARTTAAMQDAAPEISIRRVPALALRRALSQEELADARAAVPNADIVLTTGWPISEILDAATNVKWAPCRGGRGGPAGPRWDATAWFSRDELPRPSVSGDRRVGHRDHGRASERDSPLSACPDRAPLVVLSNGRSQREDRGYNRSRRDRWGGSTSGRRIWHACGGFASWRPAW